MQPPTSATVARSCRRSGSSADRAARRSIGASMPPATSCSTGRRMRLLAVRARGRLHDPRRIHHDDALPRTRSIRRSRPRSPPICARTRPSTAAGRCTTAASSNQLHRQGVLRSEARRRQSGCAAHGAGPRGDSRARRRRARQRVHADRARAVRRRCPGARCPTSPSRSCCCRAGFRSTRQGVLLVAHGDGAAVHPVHLQAGAPAIRATSHMRELFTTPPEQERHYFQLPEARAHACAGPGLPCCSIDCARRIDPLIPQGDARARATRRAENWILERLNGEDGLGAIFPAMVNALEAMVLLGYPQDDPRRVTAKRALREAAGRQGQQRVLPAVRLAGLGHRAGGAGDAGGGRRCGGASPPSARSIGCKSKQLLDEPGDWQVKPAGICPAAAGPFQFANSYYPDLDDTAVIVWAMHRASEPERYTESMRPRAGLARRACRAPTAGSPRSMSTTPTTTSTRFRSPITARCWIRRRAMSRRAW